MKKYSFVSLLLILSLFLGCSVKRPNFYTFNIQELPNINKNEEKTILKTIIKRTAHFCNYTWGQCAEVNGDTISFRGTNIVLKYKFVIDANNKLKMIDLSYAPNCLGLTGCRGKNAYTANFLPKDWGFVDYINNYQKQLANDFYNELKQYSMFKKKYFLQKKIAEEKLQQIKIKIVDNTNLLPKHILKQIKYNVKLNYNHNPLNLFINNKKNIDFKISINIITHKIGRYLIKFDKDRYVCNINKKCPNNIIFRITKVYYEFIPTIFKASNRDLDVIIKNNLDGKITIKQIKIFNKTSDFVKINTIVIYYGPLVSQNILMNRIYKIPPHSYISIASAGIGDDLFGDDFPLPKYRFIILTSKNEKVKYGVSISYNIGNSNKSLYKVRNYSLKDFSN